MAIAYSSQGAGASTETSGAALSPLCPATVNAGDILVAHVYWEGTTTAPSTPSGWTLLYGPQVIESTIARMWVFGKVADGTEDGAAVAFGSPAVTTQRAARVYSFTGRTAGTITELVTGFAFLSHATDPAMPTVTTTETGNLAVALVGQNDNNAFAAPTGESGGDWVEAVAEYTVALTPGLSLGIETATPTSNPGTISGGAMATTNDPCGVIGFQIRAAAAQVVASGVGSVVLTGILPVVTTTDNQTVTSLLGEITITGIAPTVSVGSGANVLPLLGELTLTGVAPVVSVSNNQSVAAGLGEVILTGIAPSVAVSDHKVVAALLGELILTGYAPSITVSNHQIVSSSRGEIILIGIAPSVVASDHKIAASLTGELVLSGFAPTVTVGSGAGAGNSWLHNQSGWF